jgi:uncharacterized protein YutE (UPF0331/DUF86 family)
MAPRRYRHTDNPDWEFIKSRVETAIEDFREIELDDWEDTMDVDMLMFRAQEFAEALIDLAEHCGIDTYIYGKEPA